MASFILILDDRVTNRTIYARLAEALDAEVAVRSYASPSAALDAVVRDAPDLVVTDFQMPEMDGAEFVRRLRAVPGCEDVPVIAITAYSDRRFRMRALEAGATDFLQSPVDHQEFATRARNLLRLGQHQRRAKSRTERLLLELDHSERSRIDAIRGSRERLEQVIDIIPAMISAVDSDGRSILANATYHDIVGPPSGPPSGRLAPADADVLRTGTPAPGFEQDIVDRAGRRRTFFTRKFPISAPGGPAENVLTLSLDISESKQAESHLRYLAHYDALTDLPNRLLLHTRLEEEIGRRRRGGPGFALHFIDLDRFKTINDAFGHETGDGLLKGVAGRLRDAVRGIDLVARLGGDEFAILQPETERAEDAARLAQRVIESVSASLPILGRQICTNASIGITMSPQDGDSLAELLKNADLAMYRAKAGGRGKLHFFTADLKEMAQSAVLLEMDLRQGIARNELVVQYQPQLDLRNGSLVGVEALVRWQHPVRGLLAPADFLEMAEESGLVVPLTEWVLRQACAEAATWPRPGRKLRLAVNMSSVLFQKEDVPRFVMAVLSETGLDPALLELELTETVLMQNPGAAAEAMRNLQTRGLSFAIDDFGIGYSSLSLLKLLPVNRLKIDKSFVRSLTTLSSDVAIVRAIASIGRSLDLEVVAEGVETEREAQILQREGCHIVQGYHVAPPMAAVELRRFLAGAGSGATRGSRPVEPALPSL